MDRITPLDRQDAAPEAAAVYEEIQQAFGMVPNLFKTYAHFPPLLRANWDKTKALMLGGSLPRPLKECIAVVVSQANSCRYCVAAHSAMLKQLGFTDERIQAIQGDLDAAGLSRRDAAILSFARRATLSPLDITDADVEELGLTEAETWKCWGSWSCSPLTTSSWTPWPSRSTSDVPRPHRGGLALPRCGIHATTTDPGAILSLLESRPYVQKRMSRRPYRDRTRGERPDRGRCLSVSARHQRNLGGTHE